MGSSIFSVRERNPSGNPAKDESIKLKKECGTTRSSEEATVMEVERRGCIIRLQRQATERKEKSGTVKMYQIDKSIVVKAFESVKRNKGCPGIDKVDIAEFEKNYKDNLYKIWNRMSSGSYFPPSVKRVEIPKANGKKRQLGIPTVGDRVAQMVVKLYLEPELEKIFYQDSYGYRPAKSAIDAVGKARERCWKYDWVVDIDIKGFFDNLDHELMMGLLKKHTQEKWILIYVERWLKAPVELEKGKIEQRQKGAPQGGVISPLLANLFLHYAFDDWMTKENPECKWERYADDIVIHCRTEEEAKQKKEAVSKRLEMWKLELNEEKSKIVYCKDSKRKKDYEAIEFDFLSYTFKGRKVKGRYGIFQGFNPAISKKAKKKIRQAMRDWNLGKQTQASLKQIVEQINPKIRGWINYYGKFYKSAMYQELKYLNYWILAKWARRKYKSLGRKWKKAREWIDRLRKKAPNLIASWKYC